MLDVEGQLLGYGSKLAVEITQVGIIPFGICAAEEAKVAQNEKRRECEEFVEPWKATPICEAFADPRPQHACATRPSSL